MTTSVLATPLEEVVFTVVDVETTGLESAMGDRVCEIALLQGRGDREIMTFQSLIDPQRAISPRAFQINQITYEMLEGAPSFSEVAGQVWEMINGAVLVAHNARFDLKFLTMEMDLALRALPQVPVVDTMWLARQCYSFPHNSLGAVARSLGLAVHTQHRAMADVRLTWSILRRFIQDLRIQNVYTLGELLKKQGKRIKMPRVTRMPVPTELTDAVARHLPLKMRYITAQGAETTRVIDPLHVETRNDSMYLIANCRLRGEQRTFRMDRIVDLQLLD